MDNNTEEGVITFSQIWHVFKKCLARAAIYVVVCAIVCFALLYTVRTFTKESSYSASITFKQSDENISTTLENNKATAVSAAVNTVFGSSENATEVYEAALSAVTITPYIPEANESDTTYVATTYTVAFSDIDVDDVSSAQKVSLLENICFELITVYSEVSSPDGVLVSQAWSYSPDYTLEYLDVINEIDSRLSTLQTSLKANINANTAANSKFETYKSTSAEQGRRTAAEIVASLENVATTVTSISDTIISNGVTNTNATLNGNAYYLATDALLANKLSPLTYLKGIYEKQISDLADVISSVSAGTSSGSTVVVDYSSYTSLVEQLMEVEEDIAEITEQQANLKTFSGNISTNSASNATNMTSVEASINAVVADIEDILEDYNDLVSEFRDTVMPSSYASVSKSAHVYTETSISMSMMLIIVIAVAVIAAAVAFGQTWSQLKKAGELDEPENKQPAPVADGNE